MDPMTTLAHRLVNLYPRNDRPYLNRLVACSGVLLATNAHASFMEQTTLADGHYSTGFEPLEVYLDYPTAKLFELFSHIQEMTEIAPNKAVKVWDKKYAGMGVVKHVKVGDVFIDKSYWNLIEPKIKTLRFGSLPGVSRAIAGEYEGGVFIIAGIIPDDK